MARYPLAEWKPLPQNATQPDITPRSIVLHTAVSNGTSLFSFFNGRSAGVESHFYLQEDGGIEQYIDTSTRADCQLDGNPYAISIESWDGAGAVWNGQNTSAIPAYNAAQFASLVALLAWLCTTHDIPFQKCTAYNGRGIGWHAQFTGPRPSWNQTHACPGNRKIAQVPALIEAAQKSTEESMALTNADVDLIWNRPTIPNSNDPSVPGTTKSSAAGMIGNVESTQDLHYALSNKHYDLSVAHTAQIGGLKASLDAITAALAALASGGGELDVPALIAAVRAASEAGTQAGLESARFTTS